MTGCYEVYLAGWCTSSASLSLSPVSPPSPPSHTLCTAFPKKTAPSGSNILPFPMSCDNRIIFDDLIQPPFSTSRLESVFQWGSLVAVCLLVFSVQVPQIITLFTHHGHDDPVDPDFSSLEFRRSLLFSPVSCSPPMSEQPARSSSSSFCYSHHHHNAPHAPQMMMTAVPGTHSSDYLHFPCRHSQALPSTWGQHACLWHLFHVQVDLIIMALICEDYASGVDQYSNIIFSSSVLSFSSFLQSFTPYSPRQRTLDLR